MLLRIGVLAGWLGNIKQIPDAQEQAKSLISESSRRFEELRLAEKVDEAQTELARCYWRQGALSEARQILRAVLERLADADSDTKLVAVMRSAVVERWDKKYHAALSIQTQYAALCDKTTNDALKGKFHNELAISLGIIGTAEQREDYIDRALIEYSAASYHFEQAGHIVYCACAENNLAMLYLSLNRYAEAHEHLDQAQRVLASLKDSVHLAQVAETRAKTLLAEGRNAEAERAAVSAVQILERGDERVLLAEALMTQGVALARMGHNIRARQTLERAVTTAEQAGDLETAGRASLVIIEELSAHVPSGELCVLYTHADDLLTHSPQASIATRLRDAARLIIRRLKPQATTPEDAPADWRGFSLRKAIHGYERRVIERALTDAGGMVSRAAKLLGFTYHQSLISLLNHRHKDLLTARTPIMPRRRSIIRKGQSNKGQQVYSATILHAEDDRLVADAVRETLELEGWKVVTCPDGAMALKRIESHAEYDVLLLDYDLPRINGLELVRRARQTAHRKRTPLIMLSATDCEREAWRAGVTAFLRKPEDVSKLAEIIARVLVTGSKR